MDRHEFLRERIQEDLDSESPPKPFFEDVSSETVVLRETYPDKNGKRRFSELACARAHGVAPNTHVCAWGAVAGIPFMPRWLPLVAYA